MKDNALFRDIVIMYALVSARGIIPSLSTFRQNLISKIDHFCCYLEENNCSLSEVDAMRRLLCLLFDKEVSECANFHKISWDSHQITTLYYAKVDNSLFNKKYLDQLLLSNNQELKKYTVSLVSLSPKLFSQPVDCLVSRTEPDSIDSAVDEVIDETNLHIKKPLAIPESVEKVKNVHTFSLYKCLVINLVMAAGSIILVYLLTAVFLLVDHK